MALSAGQFMELAEKLAVKAATGQAVTATTTLYMTLLTAAPTAGSDATMASETEYGATGMTRVSITTASGWNAPTSASPSVVSNTNILTWGPFSSSPGTTVTWGMLVDASSGSSAGLWIAYLLTTPRTPISGDSVSAAASAFTTSV